mgnify:CR=1 FL=1
MKIQNRLVALVDLDAVKSGTVVKKKDNICLTIRDHSIDNNKVVLVNLATGQLYTPVDRQVEVLEDAILILNSTDIRS